MGISKLMQVSALIAMLTLFASINIAGASGPCGTTPSGAGIMACIPLTITQSSGASPPNTQLLVQINPSALGSSYFVYDLQNIYVYNGVTGTPLNAWIEGNPNNEQTQYLSTSSTVDIWVKLPDTLASGTTDSNIYIGIGNAIANTNYFANSLLNIGIAPQLTCSNPTNPQTGCSAGQYAQYDNGHNVFNLYLGFISSSYITSNCYIHHDSGGAASYSVAEGISFTQTGGNGGFYTFTCSVSPVGQYGQEIDTLDIGQVNNARLMTELSPDAAAFSSSSVSNWYYPGVGGSWEPGIGQLEVFDITSSSYNQYNQGVSSPPASPTPFQLAWIAGGNLGITSYGSFSSVHTLSTSYPAGAGYDFATFGSEACGGGCVSGSSSTFYLQWLRVRSLPQQDITPSVGASSLTQLTPVSGVGITPTGKTIDSGQNLQLTASWSGGYAPYTVNWYAGSSSSCSSDINSADLVASFAGVSGTSNVLTASPTSTVYYCAAVTDQYGSYAATSLGDLVTVNPALGTPVITPTNPAITAGNPVQLTATWSGGTAQYTVSWYSGSSQACAADTNLVVQFSGVPSTSNILTTTPTSPTYYCVTLTDQLGETTSTTTGDYVTFQSTAPSITPSSAVLDSGQSVTFGSAWSYGTSPYTANLYTTTGPSCTSSSTLVQSITGSAQSVMFNAYTPASTALFCIYVTDSATPPSIQSSVTASITVNPALAANPITPSSPTISSGSPVTLTANPAGGTTPYAYQWFYTSAFPCDTQITGATGQTYTTTPSGTTSYCYQVTDSATSPVKQISQQDTVTVIQPLVANPISATQNPYYQGDPPDTLTASVTGGQAPYSYAWYSGVSPTCPSAQDSLITGATSSTYSVKPLANTYFCYVVTDSRSTSATSAAYLLSWSLPTQLQGCGLLPSDLATLIETQVPWYCPINQQIYQVWKGDLPFVFVIVLVALMLAALIFMIGTAFQNDRIRNFGIGEIYEAMASAIIVGFFLYVCAVMFGLGPGIAVGGINPYSTALNLISSTLTQAQGLYNSMYGTYLIDKYFVSIEFSLSIRGAEIPYIGLAQQIYQLPLNLFYIYPASTLGSLLIDAMAGLFAQYYLIVFFSVAAIPAFLVPGVALRAILPTRALGGMLISIAIAFYLVMPSLFAVAYYFTSPGLLASITSAQAQLQRWGTGTGAEQYAQSASSPLAQALGQVKSAMSSFWLLVLFYPSLITAITYVFITQVSRFIGGASRLGGRVRGVI